MMLKLGTSLTMNTLRLRFHRLLARRVFPCSELNMPTGCNKGHAMETMETTPQFQRFTRKQNGGTDTWPKELTRTYICEHPNFKWTGQWTTAMFGMMAVAGVGLKPGGKPFDAEKGKEFMKLLAQVTDLITRNTESDDYDLHKPWTTLFKQYPYLEYSYAMRRGSMKGVMKMLQEAPKIVKDLPENPNKLLGYAFEELQIAYIVAEARHRGVPLKLIPGDGRGEFTWQGRTLSTPEYVDAVFLNELTNKYYAVQFKCSENPEFLLAMYDDWYNKWKLNNHKFDNHPSAMQLDNVQVIGPRDVFEKIPPNVMMGQFKENINVGFEIRPLDRKCLLKFLSDNEEMLKSLAGDPDTEEHTKLIRQTKKLSDNVGRCENEIKKFGQPKANDHGKAKGMKVWEEHRADARNKLTQHAENINKLTTRLERKIKKHLIDFKPTSPANLTHVAKSIERNATFNSKEIPAVDKQLPNQTSYATPTSSGGGVLDTIVDTAVAGLSVLPSLPAQLQQLPPAQLQQLPAPRAVPALLEQASVPTLQLAVAVGGVYLAYKVWEWYKGEMKMPKMELELANTDERDQEKIAKLNELLRDTRTAAFALFRLQEDATPVEVKRQYKAAIASADNEEQKAMLEKAFVFIIRVGHERT